MIDSSVVPGRGGGGVLAATVRCPDAESMRALGRRVAELLRPGDVVLLDGPLGAGKTTLTQGIAEGLRVRGPVTSPTFVIARVHPSLSDGPPLVHVDAYRLGSGLEIDDLDLDADLDAAVTVVEWGAGPARRLADERLEVTIERASGTPDADAHGVAGGDADDAAATGAEADATAAAGADADAVAVADGIPDPRVVRLVGIGPRWSGVLGRV